MAVEFVRWHGGGLAWEKTSATTWTLTTDSLIPANSTLILGATFDNLTATSPQLSSLSKPAGETASWALTQGPSTTSSSAAGLRMGTGWIKTTVDWPAGTVITATISGAVTAKGMQLGEWYGVGSLVTTSTSANSTGGTPTVSLASGNTRVGGLIVGFAGFESNGAPTPDTDTTNGAWSAGGFVATSGGSSATNVSQIAQYKITSATGVQTYNPVLSGDSNIIIYSFDVGAPPLSASGTVPIVSSVTGNAVGILHPLLHLDAGDSASYPGSGSTWGDLGPLNQDFTLVNTPVWGPDGGGSFAFDSTASEEASRAVTDSLNLIEFTLDIWVKPNTDTSPREVLIARDFSVSGYGLVRESGEYALYINGLEAVTTFGYATTGEWVHIAAVCSSTEVIIYVNGVGVINNFPTSPSGVPSADTHIAGDATAYFFDGSVAIARIWSEVLLQEDVLALYDSEVSRFTGGGGGFAVSGTVPVVSTVSGSVTKLTPASGTVGVVSAITGTVTKRSPASGTVPIVSTVAGDATKVAGSFAVSGTVPIVSTVTGTVTKRTSAGSTVPIVSTTTGSITKRTPASGTVPIVSTITGAAGSSFAASGTVIAVTTVSGNAVRTSPLAGTVNAVTLVFGNVSANLPVSSTVPVVSDVDGTIGALYPVTGTPVVIVLNQSGTVAGRPAVSGTVPIASGSSGTVRLRRPSGGTVPVSSTVTGAVTVRRPMSGTVPIVSTVTGSVFPAGGSAGTVAIVSTVSGSVVARKVGSGAVVITSTVTGNVSVRRAVSGVVPITSNISGTVTGKLATTGTIDLTSTVVGEVAAMLFILGMVSIVSTVSGDANRGTASAFVNTKEIVGIRYGELTVIRVHLGTEIIWSP